ncbi:hypothetical protein KFK09_001008 [Dendrobium nobile]|uniref:Aminotransferase-like plant mobile domain-containing protein n=1 Tax=Dendrobium nobile TaxID=94219 RepID=A0A8T3CGD7_DENNO|nr:hypothetical protein KFK09_001008 [Dendrobium nobile]
MFQKRETETKNGSFVVPREKADKPALDGDFCFGKFDPTEGNKAREEIRCDSDVCKEFGAEDGEDVALDRLGFRRRTVVCSDLGCDWNDWYVRVTSLLTVMAFNWIRPRSMPDIEPTEERIWREIDRCDFTQSSSIRDRLSWHQEMLMDRDTYAGLFLRSPRFPVFDSELPVGYDPTDWVITLRLRHSDGGSLGRIVEGLSYGTQDVLQPAADLAEHTGTIRLLSYSLSRHEIREQQYDSVFGSPFRMLKGYISWARHVLRAHHEVLKQAGVYRAIYASLFDYSRLSYGWLQALAEHWDSVTNTIWIGPNEMTITLWDLHLVSGLPILGTPYEECIPPDYDLFSRQPAGHSRRGEFMYLEGLHQCLAHYCRLQRQRGRRRGAIVPLDVWIESFLVQEAYVLLVAQPHNPFGMGLQSPGLSSVGTFEPVSVDETHPIFARGVSEQMSLVAFVATWLCSFVFPSQDRSFRPSTLLMASLIASGRQVSLAPAVLAHIYYGFGQISASYGRRQRMVEVPWHYVHGWVHMHVEGAFSCAESPGYYSDNFFPLLIQLARAISATDRAWIRLFFFAPLYVAGRFRLVYRSLVGDLPSRSLGVSLLDSLTERGRPTLLSRSGFVPIASYFVSMRPGWLCYRRDCSIVLEGYNPNRAARQFGFVQATPLDGLPALPGVIDHRQLSSLSFSVCLEVASMTWAFLLRLGTGSRFCIAPVDSPTGISHLRLVWIRHTFSSFFELGFQRYSRRVRGSGRPRDFLESRDCAPVYAESFKVHGRRRRRSPEPSTRCDDPALSYGRRPLSPSFDRGRPRSKTLYEQTASWQAPTDAQEISHTLSVSPTLEPAGLDTAHAFMDLHAFPSSDIGGGLFPELQPSGLTPASSAPYTNLSPALSIGSPSHQPSSSDLHIGDHSSTEIPSITVTASGASGDVGDHTAGGPSGLVVELVVSSPTLSDSTWVVIGDSLGELSLDAQCTCSGSTQLLPRSNADDTTTELVTHPSLTRVVSGCSSGGSSPGVTSHLSGWQSVAFVEDFCFTGLELSYFESRSIFRARRSFNWRWPRGVQYAITALRVLLQRVDLNALPDLFSFHMEACLLLDFAASCGLRGSLLQMWELFCHTVEFGLLQLDYASRRLSYIILTDLEAEARATWDRMRIARFDLDFGLQNLHHCQRDISGEQMVLLGIEAELRALKLRERVLLERREEVRAVATHTEEDFSLIAAEVKHLEDRFSFSTEEFDLARRRLELAQEQRAMLQDRLFRVRQQISNIQFRL